MPKKKPRKPDTANQTRVIQLYNLIKQLQPVSFKELMERMEVSRSTLRRDFDLLRDRLQMPLIYDKWAGGYVIAEDDDTNKLHRRKFELPGLWLNTQEMYALLTMLNVLEKIDPGLLEVYIKPFRGIMKQLLLKDGFMMMNLNLKIGVELGNFKNVKQNVFNNISAALLNDGIIELKFLDGVEFINGEYLPKRFILTPIGWDLEAIYIPSETRVRFPASSVGSVEIIN